MPAPQLREKPGNHLCGLWNWHPAWMQRYANMKMFMVVYGLLGTIQAISYMYFIVTLTTIEKRFKIPSQTTGIILSGNEISQILLSLILSYIGGQRNRPRWIAWGIVFCGLSCYILALPHFIYGAGEDALQLTKEYYEDNNLDETNLTLSLTNTTIKQSQQLCSLFKAAEVCENILTIVPLILIFLSQFVLGIGNTLYYSLGQTYLDDNTKKTNTPLMLAVAISLRMIGPIFGFFIGFISLNMFIDPTKTPLIDNKDPRWLGAWWFGWMILGTLMVVFSGLIGFFPKQLPKKNRQLYNSHVPQVLRHEELQKEEGVHMPLGSAFSSNVALDAQPAVATEFTLKEFPKALMRLLRNKLLIFNNISGIFYILGASGYITFLTKYMEVQFHKNAQHATVIVGPVSIVGMIIGILVSGILITKYKPRASYVLFWNVIVGCIYMGGQFSYTFMYCPDTISTQNSVNLNLTAACNVNCSCDNVPYSPVCHEASDTTYFSACHAGCVDWDAEDKFYSNCSCIAADILSNTPASSASMISTLSADTNNALISKLLTPLASSTLSPAALQNAASLRNFIDTSATTTESSYLDDFSTESLVSRSRRSLEDLSNTLIPGVCMKNCNIAFWTFAMTSMVINWFGSSGRIGNILVNYRAVATEDKSFAQGLSLMMISLFALIPGPIMFGRIIDSTCLIWTKTCSGRGNCQLHDQTTFRYFVNLTGLALITIGMIFDFLVWYYGRELDLYGEKEQQHLEEMKRKNKAITPLLAKK